MLAVWPRRLRVEMGGLDFESLLFFIFPRLRKRAAITFLPKGISEDFDIMLKCFRRGLHGLQGDFP